MVEVGDLLAWLERPPTKLVAVAEPPVLAEIRRELERRLDGRAFLTTSLPYMLEIGNPERDEGHPGSPSWPRCSGSTSTAWSRSETARTTSSCSSAAGFGVAVEGAHPRLQAIADATCAGPGEQGVATVIEAVLDSVP